MQHGVFCCLEKSTGCFKMLHKPVKSIFSLLLVVDFLERNGTGLLSLKAASERWTGEGEEALFTSVEQTLESSGFEVEERIELAGYEDNHVLFAVRKLE